MIDSHRSLLSGSFTLISLFQQKLIYLQGDSGSQRLGFACSTVSRILLWQLQIGQKWQSSLASLWNFKNKVNKM